MKNNCILINFHFHFTETYIIPISKIASKANADSNKSINFAQPQTGTFGDQL